MTAWQRYTHTHIAVMEVTALHNVTIAIVANSMLVNYKTL